MIKKRREKEFYVVLDNIRSLHNVGSIFRTADGLGFKKIFLCGFTPAPVGERQERVINKTALGAEKFIEWEGHKKTWILLDKLKKQGFYILALETEEKSVPLNKLSLPKTKDKIVLVFGHEVKGLSKTILKRCDKVVKIPMVGEKESYNISISFGMAGFWMKYNN